MWTEPTKKTTTFFLSPEQALCMADPSGPADLPGAYLVVRGLFHVRDRALESFRTGQGMEWGEHPHGCSRAPSASSGPATTPIRSAHGCPLDGAMAKLSRGAHVADVGCGHGVSTILMARTFSQSAFVGIDYHDASVAAAQQRAHADGVSNVTFQHADATSYEGRYDLIAFFDCLHDMADPAGAARHARASLQPDGHANGGRAVR